MMRNRLKRQNELEYLLNILSSSIGSLTNAEKTEQEVRPFRRIDDSFMKIIVTKDVVPVSYDENDVLTVNIYDFLLKDLKEF